MTLDAMLSDSLLLLGGFFFGRVYERYLELRRKRALLLASRGAR